LLVALVAAYAVTTARRTQAELRAQLEQKATALADVVEAGSRSAIRSNALVEEMIARRLLDNARLVDELLIRPFDPAGLAEIARRNGLERIELLDRGGRPWRPEPPPAPMMMMREMMRAGAHAGEPPPMMRYMWGRRWFLHEGDEAARREASPAIADRRFWEGSSFGVAVGARSFPGIIAVHASAGEILDFRAAIGVERQVAELARQAGVSSVALLRDDLTVVAHSDPSRIGERVDDPALVRLASIGGVASRLIDGPPSTRALEVVRPLPLPGAGASLLAIRFSTEPMERAWRADVRAGVVLGAGVLLAGALGLALIFYMEHRHLEEVHGLETEVARRARLAAVGDVAAAFAHEVRNPLNAVSIGLQRLGAEFAPEPADEYGRFVGLMQSEVRRLNATVEQFLALAKPLAVAPAPFPAEALLGELAALVGAEAKAAGVEVKVAVAPHLPPIVADRGRVREALLNLLRNGLQAMPDGGVLTLGAEAERDAFVLSVTDTGPGIAPDVLPRLFAPYFTTKPDGLGLGLAITRRIAEAHGGSITVDGSPGRGARFGLRLSRRTP
jgi:signal transduction histidine kinase